MQNLKLICMFYIATLLIVSCTYIQLEVSSDDLSLTNSFGDYFDVISNNIQDTKINQELDELSKKLSQLSLDENITIKMIKDSSIILRNDNTFRILKGQIFIINNDEYITTDNISIELDRMDSEMVIDDINNYICYIDGDTKIQILKIDDQSTVEIDNEVGIIFNEGVNVKYDGGLYITGLGHNVKINSNVDGLYKFIDDIKCKWLIKNREAVTEIRLRFITDTTVEITNQKYNRDEFMSKIELYDRRIIEDTVEGDTVDLPVKRQRTRTISCRNKPKRSPRKSREKLVKVAVDVKDRVEMDVKCACEWVNQQQQPKLRNLNRNIKPHRNINQLSYKIIWIYMGICVISLIMIVISIYCIYQSRNRQK